MNSTNYPSPPIQTSEKPVITDANEDYVLEQLRIEIEGIKAEISETEPQGIGEKLGFKKVSKNAIISVQGNGGTTSSMKNEIYPIPELQEALSLALDAAPIDPNHIILDTHRVNEALATRAQVLADSAVTEAEVLHRQGGYATVLQGERLQTPIEAVRGWGHELVDARLAVAGGGAK